MAKVRKLQEERVLSLHPPLRPTCWTGLTPLRSANTSLVVFRWNNFSLR